LDVPDSDPLLLLVNLILLNVTGGFTPGIFIAFLIIIALLLCSALISGSEVAYFSLHPAQLKEIKSKQTSAGRLILSLLESPKRLLATLLISNNFVNVGVVILSSWLTSRLFDLEKHPVLGFLIQVVAITFVLVLFGEIIPKIWANHKQIAVASLMARPLKFLSKIFYPLSSMLIMTTRVVDKKLAGTSLNISMSDLSEAIDITFDKSTPAEETKILKSIVEFSDIEVREIMKSRVDVVAVETDIPFGMLLTVVVDSGYSRIPAYADTLDNIKGTLYVKDLLPHLGKDDKFDWKELLRPSFFVPLNKKINDLLKEFQEKKIHLAIVVDEYGGTSGIVTMEDIIEEIIGEITDEFDTPEDEVGYRKLDDTSYIFEGKTSIIDFCKVMDIDDEMFDEIKGDSDSLAGIILELLGEIPEKETEVTYKNFRFKIISVDKRRIKQVKVTLPDSTEKPGEDE
jgi:gliding motility-associated protein GldE